MTRRSSCRRQPVLPNLNPGPADYKPSSLALPLVLFLYQRLLMASKVTRRKKTNSEQQKHSRFQSMIVKISLNVK